MIRRPPRSTRTATLFPYTSLFRSGDLSFHRKIVAIRPSPRGGGGNFRHRPARPDGLSPIGSAMSLAIDLHAALPPVVAARRGTLACTLVLRHAGRRDLQLRYELVGDEGLTVVLVAGGISRSEQRRVGEACVRTCRSRGSPYPK